MLPNFGWQATSVYIIKAPRFSRPVGDQSRCDRFREGLMA
jgi:hypothetical protein